MDGFSVSQSLFSVVPLSCWCFVAHSSRELHLNCLTYRIPSNKIANSVNTRAVSSDRFLSLSLHLALNPRPFIKQTPNRHRLTRLSANSEISTWCQSCIAQHSAEGIVKREGLGLGTFLQSCCGPHCRPYNLFILWCIFGFDSMYVLYIMFVYINIICGIYVLYVYIFIILLGFSDFSRWWVQELSLSKLSPSPGVMDWRSKTQLLKKGQVELFTQDSEQGKSLASRDGLPCEVQRGLCTVAAYSMVWVKTVLLLPPPIFPNRYTTFYSHLVISSREFQTENNRPARRQRRAVTIDKGGTANPWHGAPALPLNAVDSALKLDTTGNDPCAVSSVSFIWSDLFIWTTKSLVPSQKGQSRCLARPSCGFYCQADVIKYIQTDTNTPSGHAREEERPIT